MLIIAHVCAEFHDPSGKTIFTITPDKFNSFLEAPEEIRQDPLYAMLAADGSIEDARSAERKRAMEADPNAGIDQEGKKINRKTARKENDSSSEGPALTQHAASELTASGSAASDPADFDPVASGESPEASAEPIKTRRKSAK